MLSKCLLYIAAVGKISYSPDIIDRESSYAIEVIVARSNIRAGYHIPICAVPVLDKCLKRIRGIIIKVKSYSPGISCRNSRHSIEDIFTCSGVRTRNNIPYATAGG